MTIILTGGGSGGHITPVMAVAAELKKKNPKSQIIYIGQKGDQFAEIPASDPNIDKVYSIFAGKFRRFHGEGLKQLLDVKTFLLNLRDLLYVLLGIIQSWRLMEQLKPDVIFSRGGYVSVPVAFGCLLNQVPYITHDSDALPSLANRIIARWAALHAVALPKDIYPYRQDKTVTTGIPISSKFVKVTSELKQSYKQELDLPKQSKVLFIIGGGQGSQIINEAVSSIIPHILNEFLDLIVIHVAGRANEPGISAFYDSNVADNQRARVRVFGYMENVYMYSGAADVIITRAGGTNLAEFAVQEKACIVIPSSFLAGGHQLKNAQYMKNKGAVIVMSEDDLKLDANRLAKQISALLKNTAKQEDLSNKISEFAKANAAMKIADLIESLGDKGETDKN